jgi:fluoride exporter
MILLAVALGGAIGAVARYTFAALVHRAVPTLFPIGTFAVNATGCLVFGLLAGLAEQRFVFGPVARSFLLVGLLGAFTTFSTFAFDSVELLRDGQMAWAALNLGGQVLAGVIGIWVGYVITN